MLFVWCSAVGMTSDMLSVIAVHFFSYVQSAQGMVLFGKMSGREWSRLNVLHRKASMCDTSMCILAYAAT